MRSTDPTMRLRRSPLGAAAVAALALGLAACGGSDGASPKVVTTTGGAGSTAVVTAAPTPRAPAPSAAAPASAAAAATTAAAAPPAAGPPAAPDGKGLLAAAVASLRSGYDVDTNVAAGGQNTNIAGRVVGANSQFALTRGDATVEYLRVPPQTWVRDPGEEWKQASDESAPRDALTPFASPLKVELKGAAGDGTHLNVTYDGAAFGSETPVVAAMVLEPDGGITITYTATTQGKPLAVTTRLAPTKDASPITAP